MATYRAKITAKGQITIPADVRRAMGVSSGDWLVFESQPHSGAVLRRERSIREVSAEIRATTARRRRADSDDDAIEADAAAEYTAEDHSAGLLQFRVDPERIR